MRYLVLTLLALFGGVTAKAQEQHHPFFDKTNVVLFSADAAAQSADFFISRDNIRAGGVELNPLARPFLNNPAWLGLGVGADVGAAYLFHRSHHHKLERLVSVIHIGGSTTGAIYSWEHR